MQVMRIVKSIRNTPLAVVDLFCELTGAWLDIRRQEIVLVEVER